MRHLISTVLITATTIVPVISAAALDNHALYQWQTKNGTPTYSPEPPPEGVEYVIVGADLKPLAVQPPKSAATADNNSIPAQTPANKIPAPQWKPVRYANAPVTNPTRNQPAPTTTVVAEVAAPIILESDECLAIKRDKLILESQFARAKSSEEMDNTVLRLHTKSLEYKERCRRG